MIIRIYTIVALLFIASTFSIGQSNTPPVERQKETGNTILPGEPEQKIVVITGARFSYELLEKWIDDYNKVNPNVKIIIESRGSSDPLKYDILAEVYEHGDEIKNDRHYLNVGRYAILPVANSESSFASVYSDKGLNTDLIKQIFFHNIISDEEKQKSIETPYTVYTRLQKAGVPRVFSKYFGHEQKNLKGTAIAGADSHLLKAVLLDSTGVSYLPLPLIYDKNTRKPIKGLTVLPVDLNGNKKVNDEEKFYDDIDRVIERLEAQTPNKIHNIPIDYLHLSVTRQNARTETIDFLNWIKENGHNHLHAFGYLKPESKSPEKKTLDEFSSKRAQ